MNPALAGTLAGWYPDKTFEAGQKVHDRVCRRRRLSEHEILQLAVIEKKSPSEGETKEPRPSREAAADARLAWQKQLAEQDCDDDLSASEDEDEKGSSLSVDMALCKDQLSRDALFNLVKSQLDAMGVSKFVESRALRGKTSTVVRNLVKGDLIVYSNFSADRSNPDIEHAKGVRTGRKVAEYYGKLVISGMSAKEFVANFGAILNVKSVADALKFYCKGDATKWPASIVLLFHSRKWLLTGFRSSFYMLGREDFSMLLNSSCHSMRLRLPENSYNRGLS